MQFRSGKITCNGKSRDLCSLKRSPSEKEHEKLL